MPVTIFFCYAYEDELLLNELKKHLKPLQRQGLIDVWHDRDISAGTEWEHEISRHLHLAQIILLLISPGFMNSDYCYTEEMLHALERHKTEDAHVIPVILRPVHWQETPLRVLHALPRDAKPVTKWRRRDDAYWDIVNSISRIVKPFLAQQWRNDGYLLFTTNKYSKALYAYNKAIQLDSTCAETYFREGNVLFSLKYYDEARVDYEQAIHYEPTEPLYYLAKAVTLMFLQKYQEALAIAEKAILLDAEYFDAYECKHRILLLLGRLQEAEEVARKIEIIASEREIPSGTNF